MIKAVALSALLAAATASTSEWKLVKKSDDAARMRFQVAMPSRNMDWVVAELDQISNPQNPRYGQWLSGREIEAQTATDPTTRAIVASWLAAAGASCVDRVHSLKCTATAAQVRDLLSVEVSSYENVNSGKRIDRVDPSAVAKFPAHIANKIEFITGLVDFPKAGQRFGVTHQNVGATDYTIVVETIYDMYQTPKSGVPASAIITAPAEFQDTTAFANKDLATFASQSGVNNWTVVNTIGPFDQKGPQPEPTLDVEYIGSVGGNLTQWYWTEADWMYEFSEDLVARAANKSNPDVISISWGWWELDQCVISPVGPCTNKANSTGFVTVVNNNFGMVTATGVTLVVASGDNGAHGASDPTCKSLPTRPDWPAASPWVLAVGATQIVNGSSTGATSPICQTTYKGVCATSGTEIVASPATGALIASGGGFSAVAAQPSWQTAAVAAYLSSGALLPPSGDYNLSTRGYPDVAGFGHNVYIQEADEGGAILVDGTSCSAPIWGGVIGQLNAARVAAGKSKLGFVNPAIYQIAVSTPTAFTDITVGDNHCTEDGCKAGCPGYGAAKGWDAVTGWGTPVYPNLLKAVLALP